MKLLAFTGSRIYTPFQLNYVVSLSNQLFQDQREDYKTSRDLLSSQRVKYYVKYYGVVGYSFSEDCLQSSANHIRKMIVPSQFIGCFLSHFAHRHWGPCFYILPIFALFWALVGCERPDPELQELAAEIADTAATFIVDATVPSSTKISLPPTNEIYPTPTLRKIYPGTPTPDPTRPPPNKIDPFLRPHIVAFGETLSYVANLYSSTVEELLELNDLEDGDLLAAGQTLMVPSGEIVVSPSIKLIPDSELVYGPKSRGFEVKGTVSSYDGYLSSFAEELEGEEMSGVDIVRLVAHRFSVNPRLLLAVLEYRSGWLTRSDVVDEVYPLGYIKEGYEGLYQQLSWAANKVNLGYYGRSEGGIYFFDIGDEYRIIFANDINDGTAGIQLMLAAHTSAAYDEWIQDIGPSGFYGTYSLLFGNPFSSTFDPLWPVNLEQPEFALPFTEEDTWYFTGGPHGGWASGSAWAALDFTPGDGQSNCETSEAQVLAVAEGTINRSSNGAVVLDLDSDGYSGTGWAVTYMHLATEDRVSAGSKVKAGDFLGYPSCEGGFSNATHLHIARTFNGRWVSADGDIPMKLGGWVSQGLGREYDGLLVKGDEIKEACQCEDESNTISGE